MVMKTMQVVRTASDMGTAHAMRTATAMTKDPTCYKGCCSSKVSEVEENFFSCEYNNGKMYCNMCKDGNEDGYFDNPECNRSGEDYRGFEDCKHSKSCENDNDNENCSNVAKSIKLFHNNVR